MTRRLLFLITAVLICSSLAKADVKLPKIFGDHMVLQQDRSVAVWGWAEPGETVKVKGDWQWFGKSTKADKDGHWKVLTRTPKASFKRHTLTVKGKNEIVLKNVMMGEVWICSGQSNMHWTMGRLGTKRAEQDIQKSNYPKGKPPQIRLFTVKQVTAETPKDDIEGTWQVCSPESVKDFSAVGYYFGKELNASLNVPVGLISTSWGGTRAEAWISRETIETFDCFHDLLEGIDNSDDNDSKLEQLYRQEIAGWEKTINGKDPGFQGGWYKPDFDDTTWQTMEQPAKWKGTELDAYDGIVWFRRFTALPPSWAKRDLQLHLGRFDDIGTVWVNGVKMGTSSNRGVYTIPASVLRVGKNSIAVRIIDSGGDGGFRGRAEDMRIGPVGADVKTCATLAGDWRYQAASAESLPRPPAKPRQIGANTPTALYNGMIAPLVRFRMAGVIWYQGESNCYDPILYRSLFPALITDWRKHWNQGDFPFYYVQIAPYQYNATTCSQAVREAQMMTLDAVKNVGMAVTMDIGEEKDIHPKNKHDVGERLARWALAKTYGKKDIVYSGPIYKGIAVENDQIRVSFDDVDDGLVAKEGGLTDFEIAGDDQVFVPATAVIDGNTVVVSSEEVKAPVSVRYGWSNWVEGSLFNKAGLPASSFRADDWPIQ